MPVLASRSFNLLGRSGIINGECRLAGLVAGTGMWGMELLLILGDVQGTLYIVTTEEFSLYLSV